MIDIQPIWQQYRHCNDKWSIIWNVEINFPDNGSIFQTIGICAQLREKLVWNISFIESLRLVFQVNPSGLILIHRWRSGNYFAGVHFEGRWTRRWRRWGKFKLKRITSRMCTLRNQKRKSIPWRRCCFSEGQRSKKGQVLTSLNSAFYCHSGNQPNNLDILVVYFTKLH